MTRRGSHHCHDRDSLIPGLPDDIAQLCLALVPPWTLYSVCRSWRRLIYSSSFPSFLSLYVVVLCDAESNPHRFPDAVGFFSFDPISRMWSNLPPPPADPPLRLMLRHPSFIGWDIPIQSISAMGCLALVAATDDSFLPSLPNPLIFDPLTGCWSRGPRYTVPRRWCVVGAVGSDVYLASGLGASYKSCVARFVERWDMDPTELHRRQGWQRMKDMGDVKFSRDAVEAVGWRGKLCMVNVKGGAAKDGLIYYVAEDRWEQMPVGMKRAWRGPAAAMNEDTIYVVDDSTGVLSRYNEASDTWVEVFQSDLFKGTQQVAVAGGRVCVLCADGARIVVVDVSAPPPVNMWVEEAPPGVKVVGIHILPRLAY